jgi:hypothetical protein
LLVLAVMVLVASVSTTAWATNGAGHAQAVRRVRLVLPAHALRAGQSVPVMVINRTPREVYRSLCFVLQTREPHGWKTIARTHGVAVPCSTTAGIPQGPHSHDPQSLILYDDLRPGLYRITMLYKFLPKHWRVASLHGRHRTVRIKLRVLRFRPGPAPHLSERQIRREALKVAAQDGDPHPTLVQHAEGTRFEANLLAGGDLVFDWQWAYLIAIRGHFKLRDFHGPPGAKPPHGTVITLVVNPKPKQGGDFGISNDYPDIAKLGPVTTDYRR